jgi:3-oxoacyl-[acyl-carrier-protein] synthase III
MSEKIPIYIFSTFGSKINEFERKKIQKKNSKNLKNLKVAGNYPNASYSIFLHEGLKKSTLKTLIFESY